MVESLPRGSRLSALVAVVSVLSVPFVAYHLDAAAHVADLPVSEPPPPPLEPSPVDVEKPILMRPLEKPMISLDAADLQTAKDNLEQIAQPTTKVSPTPAALSSLQTFLCSRGCVVSPEEAARLYTQGWYEVGGTRFSLWKSMVRDTPQDIHGITLQAFFSTRVS